MSVEVLDFPEQRAVLQDFLSEMQHCIPVEWDTRIKELLRKQWELAASPDVWQEWRPDNWDGIRMTWVGQVVEDVLDRGEEWLKERVDNETFDHCWKTPQNMDTVVAVSGLCRILLTSLIKADFIHPRLKAFWFAMTTDYREVELPHEGVCVIKDLNNKDCDINICGE